MVYLLNGAKMGITNIQKRRQFRQSLNSLIRKQHYQSSNKPKRKRAIFQRSFVILQPLMRVQESYLSVQLQQILAQIHDLSAFSQIRTNRTYNNQSNSTYMTLLHQQFVIIRFQPNDIRLMQRHSNAIYQYFQSSNCIPLQSQISHPSLLRSIKYNNGFLYPKEKSTLENELQVRRRANNIIAFSEEQILNTFEPIILCLEEIHSQNLVFGSIAPSNIVLMHNQQIMLRDKRVEPRDNPYYAHKDSGQIKKEDDWLALGQIILQTALIKKGSRFYNQKDVVQIAESLIDRFTKGFLFAVYTILKCKKDKFSQILALLRNKEEALRDIELEAFYNSIKNEKQKKKSAVSNQNINIFANVPLLKPHSLSQHESPMKKKLLNSMGNTIRKLSTKQENQVKKTPLLGIQLKSRRDKINKIIQQSNQLATELVKRKNNDQNSTKVAPKPNIANISLFASELFRKKNKQMLINSPAPSLSKNIRSVSKKK